MEAEVARAREDARSGSVKAEDVVELFTNGTDGQRIYALGIMEEHSQLAPFDVVLDAVRSPRSPLEQYHSLLLADRVVSRLTAAEKETLEIACASNSSRAGCGGIATEFQWLFGSSIGSITKGRLRTGRPVHVRGDSGDTGADWRVTEWGSRRQPPALAGRP